MSVLAAGSEKSMRVDFYCALLVGAGGGLQGRGGGWGRGIRSSVGMLAAAYRPLYKRISLLSLLLFLRDSNFSFSSIPAIPQVPKQ